MISPWFLLHFILLLIQSPASKASSISDRFDSWCKEHGRAYASDEEKPWRLKVFEENYNFIVHHNTRGNSSYSLGLNAFADLTNDEFRARHMGLLPTANDSVIRLNSRRPLPVETEGLVGKSDIPPSVDWRAKGAVTWIQDQARCDASWAFSASGAVEGINYIRTGTLIGVSTQELLDCDIFSDNKGCAGGTMSNAFEFIIKNKGIDTAKDYKYIGRPGPYACDKDGMRRRIVTIDDYAAIPAKDEKKLQQAVATQPVSAGVCGSGRWFQFYYDGIFSGPCHTNMDHAVLIVGYDSKDGKDYWIIKNSWGRYWGKHGYMYMQRNTGNAEGVCGINKLASYPIKTSPNPPPTPRPEPTICNIFQSCFSFETCCCSWEVFGICWYWGCCETESGACCKDNHHCRTPDYSSCGTKGVCLKRAGNSTTQKPFSRKSFFTRYVPELFV